jgi:hypothetical protein
MLSELFEVALIVDDLHRAMNEELAGLRPATPYQSRVASLAARGIPLVATRDSDTGGPWQFAYHDGLPFGTIELVDARMRPFLRDWWTAGRPSTELFRRSFGSLSESRGA